MENKDYVTEEVAILLSKYMDMKNIRTHLAIRDFEMAYKSIKKGDIISFSFLRNCEVYTIPCPTLWEAQKWLREEKKIFICPHPRDFKWDYSLIDLTRFEPEVQAGLYYNGVIENMGQYSSYEEALNIAIREALNYI